MPDSLDPWGWCKPVWVPSSPFDMTFEADLLRNLPELFVEGQEE